MATFNGGNGSDHINGTSGADIIYGNNGNDTLDGKGGNDTVNGGNGNDTIYGGTGDDELHGNADNDEIHGGDNNDTITGDCGNDELYGDSGVDTINGGTGDDEIYGGIGDDTLHGDANNDEIRGGDNNDTITGDDGNDNLFGDSGVDNISGGNGDDAIDGGIGNDILHGNANNDTVNGGDGDDTITGDDGDDVLDGGNNNDNVNGGSGNDIVSGGDGNDTLTGGGGYDLIYGGNGTDTAVYSGSILDYDFYTLGFLFGIVHSRGTMADGADLLLSVEKLQFSDVTIDLTQNNAPIAQNDVAATNENAGTYSSGAASVLDNDFDFEGDTLTAVAGSFSGTFGTLVLNANGTYSYVLNANAQTLAQGQTGTDVFTYTVSDGSLTDTATLTITIAGLNDAPVANSDSASATENQTILINVLTNDTDVDNGHVLTVIAASAPVGQGTASVVGNQVQFNPGTNFDHLAQGATQVVTLNYTITDEFGATSSSTVAVTVTGTNDGPVAVADTASGTENQVLLVDVLVNDTDVDDGHSFTVVSATAPSGQGSASVVANKVQFNPGTDFDHLAQGATATVVVNYTMQDEFGASSSSTLTITVTGTNDGPVAVADAAAGTENQTLLIDVLANDTDVDDGHVLTVTTASAPSGQGSASVVANQVQFNPGTDFDHLAQGATQVVTVNYSIQDEFGATSSSTIAITVTGTNDGPVAVADTASGTENQVLLVNVLVNDTDVDDGHVLTVTTASAPSGQGSASVVSNQVQFDPGTDFDHLAVGETQVVTVNYSIQDEHGASSSSNVTITVTGTNDAPTIDAGGTDDSGTVTELPNNAPGENVFVHQESGNVAFDDVDTNDVHSASATAQGGGYLGTFTLDPVNQPGDTVTWHFDVSDAALDSLDAGDTLTQIYTIEIDDGHGGTATQDVTITINGASDDIPPDGTNWYIDNSAIGSGNDGSIDDPFTSIAAFNAAQGSPGGPGINDNVFLLSGTGTGVYAEADGINLLNGQVLTGVPTGLVRPTIIAAAGDGINVAQGNNVAHIDIGNTSGAGIADSGGTVGTLTVSDVGKSGTGQIADLDQGGTLNVTLNNATSLGSSGGAIDLNAVGGSFTISGATTITGAHTGGGVDITASSLSFNLAGGGAISTGNTIAVNYVGNSGTLALGGGLAVNTTSAVGINATGGGTVTVTGAGNTLASTTGIALNIVNTTIGAADATFQSISAGTVANSAGLGIRLDTTGSLGGLHVTGTGVAGSGGTIQHKTGVDGSITAGIGIYLNNTAEVQLNWMQLNDLNNFAIRGTQVTGFVFDNSVISGTNGNAAGAFDEAAISFTNLFGSASISNSVIGNGFEYILKVLNNSGTLNRLTIDNTDFGTNDLVSGGDAVQILANGSATVNVTVTNSSFTNAREDLFNAAAQQTANMDVVFRDNAMSNTHASRVSGATHILVASTSTGNVTYDISHNDLTTGATGAAIAVVKGVPDSGSGGTMAGTVNANEIGLTGIVGSGSEFTGIFASALGSGTHTTAITNNVILHYNEEGIFLKANDPATGGNSVLNATVTGNVVAEPDPFAFAGLWISAGSFSAGENNVINVVLGNASTGAVAGSPTGSLQNDFTNGDPNDFSDVFLDQSSGAVINLSRAGSAAATAEGVVQDDNVGLPTVFESGTVNLVNTLPPTPPPVAPLMASSAGAGDDAGTVSQAELSGIVDAAIQRWADAGLGEDQLATMRATSVTAVGLHGLELGISRPGMILIDNDAAGNGWFVDSTPGDDSEFDGAGGAGDAAGHIDLLTVVMHELGHQIGLHDDYLSADADELMFGSLNPGERRLPDNLFETNGAADHADWGLMHVSGPALVPISQLDIPSA